MSPEPTPVDVPAAASTGQVEVDPNVIEQAAAAQAAAEAASAAAATTETETAAEPEAPAPPVITPEQAEAALTDECKRDLAAGRYVRLARTLRAKRDELTDKAAEADAQVTALLGS